jgi:hypothetical protein
MPAPFYDNLTAAQYDGLDAGEYDLLWVRRSPVLVELASVYVIGADLGHSFQPGQQLAAVVAMGAVLGSVD